MESTEISAMKSATEITTLLVQSGARSIATEYGEGAQIVGLKFELVFEGAMVAFALPVRVDPIYKILMDRRKGWSSETVKNMIREQAERVAWRQLLRQEVFLPYLLPHPGSRQTLFEYFQGDGLKQLTSGSTGRP